MAPVDSYYNLWLSEGHESAVIIDPPSALHSSETVSARCREDTSPGGSRNSSGKDAHFVRQSASTQRGYCTPGQRRLGRGASQQSPHLGGRGVQFWVSRRSEAGQGKGGVVWEADHGYKPTSSTLLEEWGSQPKLRKYAPQARSEKASCGRKLLVNPKVKPDWSSGIDNPRVALIIKWGLVNC